MFADIFRGNYELLRNHFRNSSLSNSNWGGILWTLVLHKYLIVWQVYQLFQKTSVDWNEMKRQTKRSPGCCALSSLHSAILCKNITQNDSTALVPTSQSAQISPIVIRLWLWGLSSSCLVSVTVMCKILDMESYSSHVAEYLFKSKQICGQFFKWH